MRNNLRARRAPPFCELVECGENHAGRALPARKTDSLTSRLHRKPFNVFHNSSRRQSHRVGLGII